MQSYRWLILAALVVSACDRPKEPDPRQVAARALRGALTFPGSSIVSVSSGLDAAEVKLTSSATVAQVADWYRETLSLNGWSLKNEGKSPDGSATIYAEKADRPIWITLRPRTDAPGTSYTLIGAVLDSTPVTPAAPPAKRPS